MWCFAGVFANFGCANVVFLRGKRGEVVVICVAKRDRNWPTKNGTLFLNFFGGDGSHTLKQAHLSWHFDAEMFVGQARCHTASRGPVKKAYLDEERLVDLLQCVLLLG